MHQTINPFQVEFQCMEDCVTEEVFFHQTLGFHTCLGGLAVRPVLAGYL